MKKSLFLFALLGSLQALGQSTESYVVTSQSINIPGGLAVASWMNEHKNQPYPYPKMYYGFAEGDEIIVDLGMENKKGTNQIKVTDYESGSVVFSKNGFQALEGLSIKIPKKAVYQFEFATNHTFDRQCNLTIKRIPATEATKIFNCNVTWKDINDTAFTTVEEKIKVSSAFIPATIQTPINYYVNSGSNAALKGGKSRITFPITLPENTVEWYYTFAATRNSDNVQSTLSTMNLLGDLAKLIDNTGALSFGINAVSKPPGANYCDVYILDSKNVLNFENKNDGYWGGIREASRENLMSGVVRINTCCQSGRYYIGLRNPDPMYGVNILIEIVAITEKANYETHQIKKIASITPRKVAVYGN